MTANNLEKIPETWSADDDVAIIKALKKLLTIDPKSIEDGTNINTNSLSESFYNSKPTVLSTLQDTFFHASNL